MSAKDDVEEISDSLTRLQSNLIEVRDTSKEMGNTWAQNAQKSKLWTAASRILSGSGLWKLQNRIRAVIDIMAVYHDMQEKQMVNTNKQTNIMNKFMKSSKELADIQNTLNMATAEWNDLSQNYVEVFNKDTGKWMRQEIKDQDEFIEKQKEMLEAQFASYALNLKKGASHEDALTLLKREVKQLEEMSEYEEKKIFGNAKKKEKFAKQAQKMAAKEFNRMEKVEEKLKIRAEMETAELARAEMLGDEWEHHLQYNMEVLELKEKTESLEKEILKRQKQGFEIQSKTIEVLNDGVRDYGVQWQNISEMMTWDEMDSLIQKTALAVDGFDVLTHSAEEIAASIAHVEGIEIPKDIINSYKSISLEQEKYNKLLSEAASLETLEIDSQVIDQMSGSNMMETMKNAFKMDQFKGLGAKDAGAKEIKNVWEGREGAKTSLGRQGVKGMLFGAKTGETRTYKDKDGEEKTQEVRKGGLIGGLIGQKDKEGERKGGFMGMGGFFAAYKKQSKLENKLSLKDFFMEKWKARRDKKKLKTMLKAERYRDIIRKKMIPGAAAFLRNAAIGFMYFMMFLLGAFIVFKIVSKAWDWIKESSEGLLATFTALKDELWDNIVGIWDAVTDIWEAFTTGTFGDVIAAVWGFVTAGLKLLWTMIKIVWEIAWTAFKAIWNGFWDWILKSPGTFAKVVAGVLAAWGAWILVKWAGAHFISTVSAIIGAVPIAAIVIGAVIVAALADALGFFASGGVVNTPLQVVGERGPELVKLPSGSRVYSNKDSRAMTGGGTTNNIHVHVNGRVGASDSEIRDIARKVGAQINREINRTTSSGTRM